MSLHFYHRAPRYCLIRENKSANSRTSVKANFSTGAIYQPSLSVPRIRPLLLTRAAFPYISFRVWVLLGRNAIIFASIFIDATAQAAFNSFFFLFLHLFARLHRFQFRFRRGRVLRKRETQFVRNAAHSVSADSSIIARRDFISSVLPREKKSVSSSTAIATTQSVRHFDLEWMISLVVSRCERERRRGYIENYCNRLKFIAIKQHCNYILAVEGLSALLSPPASPLFISLSHLSIFPRVFAPKVTLARARAVAFKAAEKDAIRNKIRRGPNT